MKFRCRTNTLVGLQVKPYEVRLVQLKHLRSGDLVLQHVAIIPLPEKMGGEKISHWEGLAAVLMEEVERSHLYGLPAVLALPAAAVRTAQLSLPLHFKEKDKLAAIVSYIKREWHEDLENLCMDFTTLESNQSSQEVFFAAAEEAHLQQYIQYINISGLNLKIIDVDTYSEKRAQRFADPHPFVKMRLGLSVDKDLVTDHADKLLIATGAALCEIPKW